MVNGHVVGTDPASRTQVADDSAWHLFYTAIQDWWLPLFAVQSGYLYAHRPVLTANGYRGLANGKARWLLVPLLTIGTLLL